MSRAAERVEETRSELVAAARAVFSEQGFHAASVQTIAKRAGFTTGALYGHFGGKDELFLAVYERYAEERVEDIGELTTDRDEPIAERARALADQWMRRHTEDPEFTMVVLEFAVHALRRPRLREAIAERHAAVRLAVARALERDALRAGLELPMPALELATALRDLGVGLALAQLLDPDAVADSLFGDFAALFVERAVVGTS